ncbi:MAG: hypothetical protein P4M09_17540 [Devosia sp.]|nr:hypothetical protein [Devosia sp.]
MANFRAYLSELVRAVAVLSLFLFALTQAYPTVAAPDASPVASVAAASVALASSALCGGSEHGDLSHSACHACRFDAAALPPAPCEAQPAFLAAVAVSYPTVVPAARPTLYRAFALSRAPPLV